MLFDRDDNWQEQSVEVEASPEVGSQAVVRSHGEIPADLDQVGAAGLVWTGLEDERSTRRSLPGRSGLARRAPTSTESERRREEAILSATLGENDDAAAPPVGDTGRSRRALESPPSSDQRKEAAGIAPSVAVPLPPAFGRKAEPPTIEPRFPSAKADVWGAMPNVPLSHAEDMTNQGRNPAHPTLVPFVDRDAPEHVSVSLGTRPGKAQAPVEVTRGNANSGVSRSSDAPLPRVENAETTIQVTIGRIEVRAAPSPSRPRPGRPRATLSLDDYLKQRDGNGR